MKFLSIQAQDFIEDNYNVEPVLNLVVKFLSIQAQDFIEDALGQLSGYVRARFLSIQAQDFIEER